MKTKRSKTEKVAVQISTIPAGVRCTHKPLISLLIVIAGFIVYANTVHNDFVFDDGTHVVDNAAIRDFRNIPVVFTHHLTYFSGDEEGYFFRPVETITFMIDYFFWGLDPFGYHVTNAILHILVALLLFFFMNIVTKNSWIAALISLIYVVHPVHTEAVAYISGRADSIASIFLLIMIILQYRYWRAAPYAKALYYIVMAVSFLLALLAKEVALVFPFLMMLFEYCMRDERKYSPVTGKKLLFYVPLFIMAATWFILKNRIVPTESMVIANLSLSTRLTGACKSLFDYVRLSLFPVGLHMEYKHPFPKSLFQSDYFGGFLFIMSFAAGMFYIFRKGKANADYKIIFFGLAWFIVALMPFLNIFFVLNAPFAEHWLYVAVMGFFMSTIYFLYCLVRDNKTVLRIAAVACLSVIAAFSYLTVVQNTVWKDEFTFYTYTVKHSPHSAKIYNNLGVVYREKGEFRKAEALFEKAIKIEPSYALAKQNLQRVKAELGEE